MLGDQPARPLSDLTDDSQAFLADLKASDESVRLKLGGRVELVTQSTEAYLRLCDELERLQTREAIRGGLDSIARGEGRPAEEFFAELLAELEVEGHE